MKFPFCLSSTPQWPCTGSPLCTTSLSRVRPGKRPRPPVIHQCFTMTRKTLSPKPKPPLPSALRLDGEEQQMTWDDCHQWTPDGWCRGGGSSNPNLLLKTQTSWREVAGPGGGAGKRGWGFDLLQTPPTPALHPLEPLRFADPGV